MMRKTIYYFIIILILFGVIGCSTTNILPDRHEDVIEIEEDTVSEDVEELQMPSKGGQLRIPLFKTDTINPLFSISKDYINFTGLIFEGLFSYDENLKLEPTLVEEWQVLENGKKWELYLKKGIKWHNGRELTAEDVKYTFDLLFNYNKELKENPENLEDEERSFYGEKLFKNIDIDGMEIMENNPYTIVLILNEPAGRILKDAFTFPILQKDIFNRDENEEGEQNDIKSLIGTGPFKVESGNMKVGGQIKLVRNDNWWKESKPFIDTILTRIYKNNSDSMEAFKKDQVDLVDTHVIFVEPPDMAKEIQIYRYLTQNYIYLGINHKSSSPLSDRRVREAIAYAIDRKEIISRVYSHNAQAVDVPIPLDSWLFEPDFRIFDYQSERAKQIIEEVGFRTPISFTISVNMDNDAHKEAANLIVEQLDHVGMKVDVRLLAWDEYLEALEQGDFDAVLSEYYLDTSQDLIFMLHSRERGNGLNNYLGYNNFKLDSLLNEAKEIDNTEELKQIYNKIQGHLVEELPIISLYYKTSSLITNKKVHGIKSPRELMIYRNIEKWYINE